MTRLKQHRLLVLFSLVALIGGAAVWVHSRLGLSRTRYVDAHGERIPIKRIAQPDGRYSVDVPVSWRLSRQDGDLSCGDNVSHTTQWAGATGLTVQIQCGLYDADIFLTPAGMLERFTGQHTPSGQLVYESESTYTSAVHQQWERTGTHPPQKGWVRSVSDGRAIILIAVSAPAPLFEAHTEHYLRFVRSLQAPAYWLHVEAVE